LPPPRGGLSYQQRGCRRDSFRDDSN
jgi:hypothetical protein